MSKHEVTSDAIVHAIDGLHAIQNAVILELLDWVVEYDTREAWKEDGACSLADWLAFRLGYSAATAREIVRAAHALTLLPCSREAFASGVCRGTRSCSSLRLPTLTARSCGPPKLST